MQMITVQQSDDQLVCNWSIQSVEGCQIKSNEISAMNKNDEVKEPSTPMFRLGRKGKSLLGKRLHKDLPSEEPEV